MWLHWTNCVLAQVICKQGSDADELFFVKVGYVRMLRAVDMPPLSPRAQVRFLCTLSVYWVNHA